MGDDQCRRRVAFDERGEAVGDRRQSPPAMDQDRHPAGRGELEDGPQTLVGGSEALRARVQLDPAGTGVEAAYRLLERALVEIEANEESAVRMTVRRVRGCGRSPR